ncbi:ABC transporter permease [Kitasatospora sp. HPMI-4]|uniref:ABC transporter permease n=1 Tax=Kitasatospora sp. HPMI-4 TaxID=3448443 RepID=UPI003F1C1778
MPVTALLHSEWLKVRSLRSQLTALAAVPLGTVVVSALLCGAGPRPGTVADPLQLSYGGVTFGQMAAVAFGAMVMGAEYRDGALRLWLTAAPGRGRFYAAKLAVVGGLSLIVGLVTGLLALLTGKALLSHPDIGGTVALRSVLGCALYTALVGVFAMGLTAVVRGLTGALCVLVPLFTILPFILGTASGRGSATDFLPDQAGRQILLQHPAGALGPWSGMAVLIAWAALAVAAGWWTLNSRDA